MTKDLGFRSVALAVLLTVAPLFAQGKLTRVFVAPSDTIAGAPAFYTLSFRTSLLGSLNGAGLPAKGRIRVTFDSTFTDSTISAAFNVYGVTGGYDSIKVKNHKLTLYRDGTGATLAAGDSAKLHLAIVYNSTLADTFQLFVETLNDTGAVIDTAKTAPFRIVPGALHHFAIDSVGTQTVGVSFSVKLSARDRFENLVKKFKRYVIFSANQGVVEPDTSGLFVNGALTDTVFLNIAGAGRVLTVRDTLNHVGASNPFLLNPGPLHHFAVSNIASPQTVGIGFPVTFTAQDTFNNTISSFIGTATLSATTGAPTPLTTGAFTAGTRTESVSLNLAATNDTLIVSANGKSGRSNSFNVNAGALHHFHFDAIAAQKAGVAFNVTMRAHDVNHNPVSSFIGSVSLSDNTGSLSPTNSGAFIAGVGTVPVTITKANGSVVISANDGNGHLGQSAAFVVTHNDLDHFAVTNTSDANISAQTAGTSFNIKLVAQDAFNNTVVTHTGAGSAVTLANTSTSIAPVTSGNFTNGVLSPLTVTIAKTSNADAITVTHAASGKTGVSNAFAVNHGAHADFRIDPVASPQTAGSPFALVVKAVDGNNNTVTSFAGTVNISVSGGGTITPTVSGSFINGVWNGSVTISNNGNGRVITVSGSGFTESSNAFNVNTGGLASFVVSAITDKVAGQNFSVTVTAKDANGNDFLHSGTVNLSDNTGTLTASQLVFTNQASVTISDANITKAQTNVVITASGSNRLGQSNNFNITPAALNRFAVKNTSGGNIASQQAGTSFNVRLEAQDQFGNIVTSHTGPGSAVTISNTTASIAPTTSGLFTNGVLASQSVTINKAANADAITVNGGSPASSGTSNTFAVNPGQLNDFRIANVGTPQTAGSPFPLIVTAVDANDNTVTSFAGTVNISVSGGGTITPTVSGNFINGVWSGSVTISNTGNNRIITVTDGTRNESSNAFNVVSGTLAEFVISAITDKTAGQVFSVTVTAKDANGNNLSHNGTVTLSDNTGTLTASPLVFNNQVSQTINDARITKALASVEVYASGSGKTSKSNTFAVNHAALDHFVVTNATNGAIAAQTAGLAFNIKIAAQDTFGNIATSFNQFVTITDLTALNFNSGNFTNGVLNAQSVTVNQTRTDNQLTVSGGSPAKTGASNLFNVNPGALNGFTFDTISDQATNENFVITIRARDAQNNLKTDFTGTVTLSDLTGTVSPVSSAAFIGGVGKESVRITQPRTANTITAQGGGRQGVSNPFNVQAITIDHFDISTVNNVTAGTPFSLTIIARDASNNPVTNFTGNVTLSDLSGSITPTTSNNFIAGTLTQNNFTITKSFTNNRITVTGVGRSNTSNAFNVTHAQLAKFFIPTITDQTAGQSFPLSITAQDQYDNKVLSFTNAVSIEINSGTIAPTTSGAFVAGEKTVSVTVPEAGNNRIITVKDATNKVGVTNSFNVSASGLAKFVFSAIGTQTAGAPFSFTITARDQNDNDVVFNGTVTLSDATNTLSQTSVPMNGTSVTVSNVTITKAQSGVFITASGGGKTGQSLLFNVNAAGLHRVRVVEGNSGDGAELGAKTLDADKTLPVHAAGYDLYNNYLGDQSVNWFVIGPIGNVNPNTNVAATIFEATKTGTGRIVANHATAIDDSSGVITIIDGAPYRVKILSGTSGETSEVNTLGLVTGQFQDLHAASFDRDDNYIQDVTVTWSVTGSIGNVSPGSGITTRFTATTKGTGQVNATHATLLSDATGTITVTEGSLAKIRIVEGLSGNGSRFTGRDVTTDGSFTLHAAGYDANDNYLGDYTVNWIAANGRGTFSRTFDTSTVFDPQIPGTERIRADHPSAQDDSTSLFTISTGVAKFVKVLAGVSGPGTEVQDVPLTTGDTFDFHASSFDQDNNRIGDVSVTWKLSAPIGTLNPTIGTSTRLTATTVGSAQLTADHASLQDDATGTITVSSGNLFEVRIVRGPSGPGAKLGGLNLTTDDVLDVHAAGYDAQNNYLGDYDVNWSVSGGIGTLNVTQGKATTLTLTRPFMGKIFADHVSARDDSTGTLNVSTGALHHIKILAGTSGLQSVVDSDTLTTDENLPVHAGGFDADDNYKNDVSVAWSITGTNIGTLTSANGVSTILNPNRVGVGQIRAQHAVGAALTGPIIVNPGILTSIKIVVGQTGNRAELRDSTITTDNQLTMHVAGYDNDGNYIRDENVTWSSAGLAPAVSATGTAFNFSPTLAPRSGIIRATHATAGFDTTGTISVNVGRLHHVVVLSDASGNKAEQGDVTLQPGATLTVHAGGFDAKNNYRSDEIVNWSLDGSNGNLSVNNGFSTTFTAVRANQTSSIRAVHPTAGILGDNSGVITVSEGTVNSIVLRTAPNNGGAVFNTLSMSADDEVTIYAASYDVGGNYIGDRSVTWSRTGNLTPAVNATGSSFTFAPTLAAADGSVNGTIVGTYAAGINDATGLITVLPGAPSGSVTLIAASTGLPADGASTSQITSTAILDAEGNNVGANRRFTVAVVPPTYGDIVESDVDPVAPGKQLNTNAQGQLVFTFRAGTTGGVATINVNSNLASGSTQITLGSLNIVSVTTSPVTVTRGQSAITVNMIVQNLGAATIQNLAGGLTFFGTQDRTPDYVVTPSGGNPTSVAGNTQVTLSFEVQVRSTAALETVTINGQVSGTVNGSQVSDNDAGNKDAWSVLRPAAISILRVTTSAPDTVARATINLPVSVQIANNLSLGNSSNAIIDSVRLRFFQGPLNRTSEYVVAADPNNPQSLGSGATGVFNFTVNILPGATLGLTTIDAVAYGRDANSNAATQDLSADVTDNWFVIEGNALRIIEIKPSQPTVTAGMSKPWQITMKVQNLSAANLTLDLTPAKTYARMFIGNMDVTPALIYPTQMQEGGTLLRGNSTGTLVFGVNQTGLKDGVAAISGFALGKDASGLDVNANTNNGGGGEVTIQTPGTMEIAPLTVSQPTVTAGQTAQWTVTARVTNSGQSTVRFLKDSTFIAIGNNVNYFYSKPARFSDGDSLLRQNETKSLVITVTKTGDQFSAQPLPITVRVKGAELNSNRMVTSTIGNGTVLAQSAARLVVKSVRASQSLVSVGQTRSWQVFMVVQNTGESSVTVKTDTSTNLRFRIGNQFQNDYAYALNPQNWLSTSSKILAGNATDSLRFNITLTGQTPGVVQLWPKVAATENNSGANVVGTDNGTTNVTAQAPPNVSYIPNSLTPKTPNIGSQYAFKVRVRNTGSARIDLLPPTRILFTDGANNFSARLDLNFNTVILPNDTTLTFIGTPIPSNMTPGKYPVTLELRGTQNGNGFQPNIVLSDSVLVTQPGQLQVVSMRASQPTVTRQMGKPWYLVMAVRNNGGFNVALDSARVQLFNGGDVTSEYQILRPLRFMRTNGTTLAPQTTDSLRFDISRTGVKTGPVAVIGRAWLTDQSNQNKLPIASDGNSGGFVVQSPGELQILSLTPSQTRVTRDQTQPWFVDMGVKNNGESEVRVEFADTTQTRIDFSTPSGYRIKYPTAFMSGGNVIRLNETRTLRFEVSKTGGDVLATNTITGKIRGTELNSGDARNHSGGSTSVKVETEARVRLSNVALRDIPTTPNRPFVNTGQAFQVQVVVENLGQENADSVRVRLRSNGASVINPTEKFIVGGVSGGLFNSVTFDVTASSTENARETFTATIMSAKGKNTGANVAIENPVDDSEFAVVQRPAGLYIAEVKPSRSQVPAFDNRPWYIYVVVQDTGGAAVVLNAPKREDVVVKIDGEVQTDYTIDPPTALSRNGNLILPGGQTDTLVYTVRLTGGQRGGMAALETVLGWKDQNNNQAGVATMNGQVTVTTQATVKIEKTTLKDVYNLFSGTSVGLVNTSQSFALEVLVANGSLVEDLENIIVELTSDGNSQIQNAQQTIARIPQREEGTVRFEIVAASAPTAGNVKETFTARIVGATASRSGLPAEVLNSSDPADEVRIQLPAQLALAVRSDFTNLTTRQKFNLTATVANRENSAGFDEQGELTLFLPQDFTVESGTLTRSFTEGQSSVTWSIGAPATASEATLFVRLTKRPLDLNSRQQVDVSNTVDSVAVRVVFSNLSVNRTEIIAPEGARDGVLSNTQSFTVESNLSFSQDVEAQGGGTVKLILPPNSQYAFKNGANDATRNLAERHTWELLAPNSPEEQQRWIVIHAEGRTGTGERVVSRDSITVSTVQRALITFAGVIRKNGGAENELSLGQAFTIEARLNNTGDAKTLDSVKVLLQLGETGVITQEELEKVITFDGRSGSVTWQAQAPDVPTPLRNLTLIMQNRPRDENSYLEAAWDRGEVQSPALIPIRTDSAGTLFVTKPVIDLPSGATDGVLSTLQEFRVQAVVKGTNLANVNAELKVPAGFEFVNESERIQEFDQLNQQESLVWRLKAPVAAAAALPLYVNVDARDANSGRSFADYSDSLFVEVVARADLRLEARVTAPFSVATDYVASTNQLFEITAQINNFGTAKVVGADSIELVLPTGGGYSTVEPLKKSSNNSFVVWQIKARNRPSTGLDAIAVIMRKKPLDENTDQPALVSTVQAGISMRTEDLRLSINTAQQLQGGPVARKQQDVPLMILELRNEGNESSSGIVFKSMQLYVQDREGKEIAPNTAVKRVRVIEHDSQKELGRLENVTATNPLSLSFATPDTIAGGGFNTINVLVDIADDAAVSNFFLAVRSGEDVEANNQDAPYDPVAVTLAAGAIQSAAAVLFADQYDKSFYNYPNPFAPDEDGNVKTKFNYYLPQDSEVDLRIYTLLGELVYAVSYSASDPQGRAGARNTGFSSGFIEWDGRNGNKKLVLNGVYLAVLKTNAGTVMTKVAVVK